MNNTANDFFQLAPSLFCILDNAAIIIQVNQRWEQDLGVTVGTHFRRHVHPADLEHTEQYLFTLQTQDTQVSFSNRWLDSQGCYRWMEWQARSMEQNGQKIWYVVANDVTQQRQTEQTLASNQERFELAIRGANHGLWDWNLRTNEVYFSPRWKAILGYYEHEIPNHLDALLQCIHPDDFPRVWNTLESYLDKCTDKFESVYRMLHKDGSQMWVLAQAAALWDEQEQPYRMVGTYVDVTPYKELEHALQESEDLLTAIFDVTQIGVCVTDEEGYFVRVNSAYCDLYGYAPDELLGQLFTIVFPAEKRDTVLKKHKRFLNGETESGCGAWQVVTKQNRLLDVEITVGRLQRPNGQKFKVTTVMDVTARKRTEAERNRLFNLSVDMQAIVDFNGYLKELNAAWETTLGWKKTELLSKHIAELVHPNDHEILEKTGNQLRKGVSILDLQTRVLCKNNAYKCLSWNIYPIPEQKTFYTIVRDITETKLAAERIQQQQDFIRLVLDTIPNIIFIKNQANHYIFANQTYANLLDTTVDQLVHSQAYQGSLQYVESHKIMGHIGHSKVHDMPDVEELCFNTDDSSRCFHIEKRPFIKQDGESLILAVGTDITERKRQEEALKRSEERLRIVTAGAPLVLFAFDKNGIFTFARGKALSIFQLEDDEIVGQSIFQLCEDFDLHDYIGSINKALAGEAITSLMKINSYTLESTLSCYFDPKGEVTSVIGVAVDITKRYHLELQYQELIAELETILDNSVIGIAYVKNECFVRINQKLGNILDYQPDELFGLPLNVLYASPQTYLHVKERAYALFQQGQDFDEAQLIRKKNGQLIWARMVGKAVDDNDLSKGLIWMIEDITLQKQAEQNLRLTATIFETSADAILVTDLQNRISRVNPAFTRITGYQPEEIHGQKVSMLSSGRHSKSFYQNIWKQIKQTGHWQGEIWNRRKNGEIYVAWLSISVITDENDAPQHYMAILSDISRLQEDIEAVRYLASYDSLTNLPNRLLFHDNLLQAQAWARRHGGLFALLFIDLDGFKPINDQLGHAVGDQVLQSVAQRMVHCVRETDTVARIGGDEFVIILAEIHHIHDAELVGNKVLRHLESPFLVNDHEIHLSASIGISIYPKDTDNVDDLIEYADIAMYVAKRQGKGQCYFYGDTHQLDK
ncbi:PAS domain S-box protein [Candidatus Albibeggiatoa sp. nov. NOAA]|uniref:PAS domain S-box protein n=1 Tax=Candidatus Albibeggiatoa sp. nov. NOAA TaxID=3162724 RepID=UPI00330440FE|nr:PAS domain S-box protein [Thiotrichaceae bacterium]